MKKQVIESILENKIVVIVRGLDKEPLLKAADAMYEGGIRLLEITYDSTGAYPDEKTADNIMALNNRFNGKMTIGAGTVLKESQVELTKASGGRYIISPDTNEAIIKKSSELDLVSMPGAMTPTEIQAAYSYGADFVKLFPINNLGIDYVRAVMAPLAHIPIIAVGGINEDNMAEFLKAGVKGFGIGNNIVKKDLIKEGRYDEITKLAKRYTSIIRG
ncbi:MAG: bifunctional 4-hydroxy-2-oxoglutarate aldolase/2-dehydro-3-deoxy-phosphogluconate aldolase [Bacillota bacterium]|nr:bifunctional 4-hydroxy-2-oxoglutarate aldolase/2-dehydro-3-deoxy-phosphogluconate aldolase [Bacillota bacterium]